MALYRSYSESRRASYWYTYDTGGIPDVLQTLHSDNKAGRLENLGLTECINRYATGIQSTRRHVLLVASDDNLPTAEENRFIDNSHVYWASPFYAADAKSSVDSSNSYNWICSGLAKDGLCSNDIDDIRSNVSAWSVGHYCLGDVGLFFGCNGTTRSFPVQYCLSQKAEPHCRLQFDTSIAVVVTILNAGKFFPHQIFHGSISTHFVLQLCTYAIRCLRKFLVHWTRQAKAVVTLAQEMSYEFRLNHMLTFHSSESCTHVLHCILHSR